MRHVLVLLTATLTAAVLWTSPATAQGRALTGTVTDSATGQPVSNAQIAVRDTRLSATSRENGTFVLPNVPEGDLTLTIRAVGFHRLEVSVDAQQTLIEIQMGRDIFKLDEIVITGQSSGIEQRNLANAVSTVSGADLNRAPSQTLESALQGKVAGALIQANGGAPGGGIQISLRGVSTINGPADPLYVVDGIVVSDVAIPNGQDKVSLASAGGNPQNQENPVNRIADLNPADIEKIEILKGGSAAAIYGSKATNGVVVITTKRGQAGRTTFNFSQGFGVYSRSNSLGSRTFPDSATAAAVFGDSLVGVYFQPGRTFSLEDEIYGRKALSTQTMASLSGGSEQTRFYLSGLAMNDEGIAVGTGYQKQSVRANLDQSVNSRVSVAVNTNVIHSLSQRGLSNNDNSGTSPYMVLPFTPNFWDPLPTGGVYPDNPFERSNPLATMSLLTNDEDVWRALGTITTRVNLVSTPRHLLNVAVIGGADYFNQRNVFFTPPQLQFEPLDGLAGTVVQSRGSNLNLNLAVNGTHTYTPASRSFEAVTTAGVQYEKRELNTIAVTGRGLPTGQPVPDLAESRDVLQRILPVRDLGIYGQEEVLLDDRRLLLTAGFRADRSSVNGDPGKYFVYPKGAASYRLLKPVGPIEELKLRAAVGQTGNQPIFGARYVADTTGILDGRLGQYASARLGDRTIKPERQTEIETGFDAQFAGGKGNISFTVYQRTITDLLLDQTIAPSTGYETRIFNSGGKLRNRGIEVAVAAVPWQRATESWILRATFFANRSKITKLPIPTFQTGGFGTSLGTFQIEQGKSATQIVGTEGVVGDANPDFQMSFSSDLQWRRFGLSALVDWKHGGDIVNLTQFLYDIRNNSADQADGGAGRFGQWASGKTKTYVQDGSYVKLREVNLSYELPSEVAGRIFAGAHSARFSLSGRNLLRSTPYKGLDPEVSNFGSQAIVRNIDVAPFPPSRSFFFTIDLGF